jgi:hypothetical protein
LAWTLSVALFALLLASSQPFHSCIQEADKYYRGNASQEGVFDILVVLKTFKSCIGVYILEKNAVITALATIAIAAFTGTIWAINKSQLAHGQQVERAYISGGGATALIPAATHPVWILRNSF